ncbi:MAG: response regulator transcription factor [Miniphocaeibacter sp.]|uniref:response regulator transcription factor n=1 Tax=Miniphocaeibacter sp. TaxID=3100973 RepID=UPI0017DB09FB|nr:response regulator transcription factor [Gallicola sp.]
MAKILAVDDNIGILKVIDKALRKEGHVIKTEQDPKDIFTMDLGEFDLILLDVMMPEVDGFEICKNIREDFDGPIIFLTALDDENSLIKGLGLGGDDYLSKPFSLVELRARVNAHIRREKRERVNHINLGEIKLNIKGKEFSVKDNIINLTSSEYEIAELLALNRNQVFSREQIFEKIYGYDKDSFDSTITEHIKNIRRKFKKYNISPIKTEWGIGYRWKE